MRSGITAACIGALVMATAAHRSEAQSLHVCVGADRVVRYVPGTACPAGQASHNLALEGTQPTPPDEDKTLPNQISELKKTIDFLRDRVSNLEKESDKHDKNDAAVDHIVHAPFHVVDKSGKAIFTVTDGDAKQATGRVRVAHGPYDNYGVWVMNASGTLLAALAETNEHAGSVIAFDKQGRRHIQANGGGDLTIFSSTDKDVASLGVQEGKTDRGVLQISGILQIFDGVGGKPVVEAGTSPKGVGVVQVGPGTKCVPMGTLRVPDCIMGRQTP